MHSENYLYNPQWKQSHKNLEVFHAKLHERLLKSLRQVSLKEPCVHQLIVGETGTGKTFLLWGLYQALKQEGHDKIETSWVGEDGSYRLLGLQHFGECLLQELEGDVEKSSKPPFVAIQQILQQRKKQLIIFIDRWDWLSRSWKEKELREFREILLTSPYLRLVGTVSSSFQKSLSYQEPFYEFFQSYPVKPLSDDQAEAFLKKKPARYDHARFKAAYSVFGGSARILSLLKIRYQMEVRSSFYQDALWLFDQLTPVYLKKQHELSKQQKMIWDTLAKHEQPMLISEMTQKLPMESRHLSSLLHQLSQQGLIQKEALSPRKHAYQIKDRLWQLWYLLRYYELHKKGNAHGALLFKDYWYVAEAEWQQVLKGELEGVLIQFPVLKKMMKFFDNRDLAKAVTASEKWMQSFQLKTETDVLKLMFLTLGWKGRQQEHLLKKWTKLHPYLAF